ncbi:MAG TPA: phosphatase PAP2 family protein [Ilumatobacteraceae bacterium]|nr:phosphatase PAP2 family protein [Ilumatobacteraceae bacterium]
MNLTMPVDRPNKTSPRLTLILAALILVAIPFGILLVDVLRDGPLSAIDQQIANRLNTYNAQHDFAFESARVVTQLGSTGVLTAVVIVSTGFLGLIRKRRRQALFLLTTALLGTGLNNLVKVVVGRNRPHFEPSRVAAFGKSFPSGHAMNATVVYCILLILIWPWLHTRRRRLLASFGTSLLVVLIAASRVVLTVHYVSDVAAGITLGVALVCASTAAFAAWPSDSGRLPEVATTTPPSANRGKSTEQFRCDLG